MSPVFFVERRSPFFNLRSLYALPRVRCGWGMAKNQKPMLTLTGMLWTRWTEI
jgi:hypothetical protein